MISRLKSIARAFTVAAAVLALTAVHAVARDQDAARRAVQAGEIRPLQEIMDSLRGRLPGDVVGVKLEKEDGRWVYEFRTVDDGGRLFEVYVDGRSGAIVRVKEK